MTDPLHEPGLDPVIQFLLLCDYAAAGAGGKLTLVGQFQSIGVRQLPIVHPRFFIVFGWRGMRPHTYRVEITPPGNDTATIFRTDDLTTAKEQAAWGHIIIEVVGLGFREAGTHWVRLVCDGWKIADHPLVIYKVEGPHAG